MFPSHDLVEVNVYVKTDNLCVNVPYEGFPLTRAESEVEKVLNPTTANQDHISDFHFGEQILSFRALLKRYETVDSGTIGASAGNTYLTLTKPIVPQIQPSYGGGATTAGNLLSYLRYAYVGLKGGYKYRLFYINGDHQVSRSERIAVRLPLVSSTDTDSSAYGNFPPSSTINGTISFMPTTNSGVVL